MRMMNKRLSDALNIWQHQVAKIMASKAALKISGSFLRRIKIGGVSRGLNQLKATRASNEGAKDIMARATQRWTAGALAKAYLKWLSITKGIELQKEEKEQALVGDRILLGLIAIVEMFKVAAWKRLMRGWIAWVSIMMEGGASQIASQYQEEFMLQSKQLEAMRRAGITARVQSGLRILDRMRNQEVDNAAAVAFHVWTLIVAIKRGRANIGLQILAWRGARVAVGRNMPRVMSEGEKLLLHSNRMRNKWLEFVNRVDQLNPPIELLPPLPPFHMSDAAEAIYHEQQMEQHIQASVVDHQSSAMRYHGELSPRSPRMNDSLPYYVNNLSPTRINSPYADDAPSVTGYGGLLLGSQGPVPVPAFPVYNVPSPSSNNNPRAPPPGSPVYSPQNSPRYGW